MSTRMALANFLGFMRTGRLVMNLRPSLDINIEVLQSSSQPYHQVCDG